MNEANIYIYIWNTESLKLIKFDRDRCKSVNIPNSTQISTKFYQTLKEEKKIKIKFATRTHDGEEKQWDPVAQKVRKPRGALDRME